MLHVFDEIFFQVEFPVYTVSKTFVYLDAQPNLRIYSC